LIAPITEASIEEIETDDEDKQTEQIEQTENKNTLLMAFINNDVEDQEIWINVKTNLAMDLAIEEAKKRKEKTLDEINPEELADYKDVFNKKATDRFSESRSYIK
jgi:hypothetical protein